MYNEPQKLFLPDVSNRTHGITMQVNWNKAVRGAKFLKLKLGKEELVVSREHLETILFMIGDEQSQTKFVGQRATMHQRKKIPVKLFVQTTKDMRKGETIIVNYFKDVPADEAEELRSKGKLLVV